MQIFVIDRIVTFTVKAFTYFTTYQCALKEIGF